jgi:protocatechuate 3,4-dioxygenase beta subunit
LFGTGYAEQRISELTVRPGVWIDLGAIALDAGRTLRGRVTIAGTQLPAPNAVVSMENADPLLDLGSRNLGAATRRSVQVDGIGRYELAHLPAHGMWRLIALAPGFARQIRNDINLAAVSDAPVDFELLAGLSIAGRLDGSDGRPVVGARIEAWPRTAEPAYIATSGVDGQFRLHGLREGPHRLRVLADGYQTLDRGDVAAGTQSLVLSLQRRGGALVTVRDPDGAVLREYRLAVRRYLAEAGGGLGALPDLPERTVHLGPDELQATVTGLEPGPTEGPVSYVFQVEASGFAKTLSAPFTIDPIAPTRVEMTMTRGGSMVGRVLDERGEPIAGARVSTQPAGAVEDNPLWRALASLSPDRITRTTATTGADGSWRLEGLAYAAYQLEIVHDAYCRTLLRNQQVIADVEQTVPTVTLRRGTQVRGRTLVDGSPHGQVCVVLTPAVAPGDPAPKNADESTPVRVEAVSDNDGFFTLPRRIPPGLYELRARLQRSGDDDLFVQMQQMQRSATTLAVPAGRDTIEQDVRIAK